MSNIRPYVIINGVDSRTIQGLLITSLPPISKPTQRTLTETIDGRDGDSSIKLGFSAYDKSLGIALTYGYNVDDVIAFFNSEGTIIFSNEPDKLYNFEIFEQIDLEKLIRFKTGTVTIHTQPFKFSTSEDPIEFTEKEFTVVNSGNTDSRPNIVVTGEGLATMQINGKNALNIDFGDAEQTLLIDSEGMNAYYTENIKNIEAEITPKQDLHGFNSPFIDSDKVNKVPYLSRALAGTAERIGNYEYNKLVGGTVAFNQNCQVSQNALLENVATKAYSGGVWTFTATDLNSDSVGWYAEYSVKANHICFIAVDVNPTNSVTMKLGMIDRTLFNVSGGAYTRIETLRKQDTDARPVCYAMLNGLGLNSFSFSCKNVMLIDLTQMLGATIADYIYSLEQAQTRAGVAYFRALFSADYYPYNAGELMNVKTSAHVTKKANNTVIQTVVLDPNLELRGVAKLDENNKLYYDGDTYSADGSVGRRYGVVDIGALNWNYQDGLFQTRLDDTTGTTGATIGNYLCAKYLASNAWTIYGGTADKVFYISTDHYIRIKDSAYTDKDTFKSANNGIYILYEKATPASESAQAFNNPIEIDANGSEEFTDSRAVAIPVGHESYYANICDIEGFTEVNLVRAGVNLWDGKTKRGYIYNGTYYSSDNYWCNDGNIPVKPNTTYTLQGASAPDGQICFYDENNVYIPNSAIPARTGTFTTPSNAHFISVYNSISTLNEPKQLELGSEATSYESYAGEIFNKQFEQEGEPVTVYGGKYNFITGLLEITHAKEILTGANSEVWSNQTGLTNAFSYTNANIKDFSVLYEKSSLKTSAFKTISQNDMVGGLNGCSIFSWGNQIVIRQPNITSVEAMRAWLNANNLQVCYELAEHIFMELDPETISALLGINNFYADTGEVTITFVNDGQDETQTGLIVTFDLDESDLNRGDLANRLVNGNYDNIRLKAGANSIKFIGSVSAVGLDKYSRWL